MSFSPSFGFGRSRSRHGGEASTGKRKLARPFDRKRPMHIVLKSSKARGAWSMLLPRHRGEIEKRVRSLAKAHDIHLFNHANVGTHLHLLIQAHQRAQLQAFLRKLAGSVAFLITGCAKGRGLRKADEARGFWDHLAFSRLVNWGKDLAGMKDYILINLLEAAGATRAPGAKLQKFRGGQPPPGYYSDDPDPWRGWDAELEPLFAQVSQV